MKFINYIEKIAGIDVYGLLSLIIFFTVFTVAVISAFATKKQTLREINQLPLDN